MCVRSCSKGGGDTRGRAMERMMSATEDEDGRGHTKVSDKECHANNDTKRPHFSFNCS